MSAKVGITLAPDAPRSLLGHSRGMRHSCFPYRFQIGPVGSPPAGISFQHFNLVSLMLIGLNHDCGECGFTSKVGVVHIVDFDCAVNVARVAGLLQRAERRGEKDEPWVGILVQKVWQNVCYEDRVHGVDSQVLTYLLKKALRVVGGTAVVDEAIKMAELLFNVFDGCSDGWTIRDIDHDRFYGTFGVRDGLDDLESFASIFGNTAVNENMVVVRGEEKLLGGFKADAFVGTCTVSAIVLWKGIAWSERYLEQSSADIDMGTCLGEEER